ncbi:MAG: D-alanyl-D-alanine carboxypeptidase/D-alanyl-D-alanine-endopeptidase [Segetibacter sp.]
MKSALIGFYVSDRNGAVVFDKNATIGLAVASSQKVITSAASLELLGTNYRYKTELAYDGKIENGALNGNIYIVGYGDPTLGSWRYDNTKEQVILNKWIQKLKQVGVRQLNGNVIGYDKNWESQTIPGGWIWDDIGNYYGAGVSALNWRENQYDLQLKSGNEEGDKVTIVSTVPKVYGVNLTNELTTGLTRKRRQCLYLFASLRNCRFCERHYSMRVKIPLLFQVLFPNPALQLTSTFIDELRKQGISITSTVAITVKQLLPNLTILLTDWSPALDSMNYWFLKKA